MRAVPNTLLYLTADGLMEALGFSQVVRVIEALAARGWRYEVISLEKPNDLGNEKKRRFVEARLAAAGIRWKALPWSVGGTPRAALDNESALVGAAMRRVARGDVAAIHARAYHSAVAALCCELAYRVPFLFDTRSYWFDERIEEGRWFTTPLRLGVARGIEYQLFNRARAVVSLTELQSEDVRAGAFGARDPASAICIPTCADFDDFVRRPVEACAAIAPEVRARLAGRRVLGIVGSINRSYLVDETFALVREVMRLDPRTHLLVLSAQRDEYLTRLKTAGVPADSVTVVSAEHHAMPQWLSVIDWAPLLLRPASRAKRASMPTKLAEFFAMGIRPIHFGCNTDVGDWVRRVGTGLSLESVDSAALVKAAEAIVRAPAVDLAAGRKIAQTHFSLRSGVDRYDRLLSGVMNLRAVAGNSR